MKADVFILNDNGKKLHFNITERGDKDQVITTEATVDLTTPDDPEAKKFNVRYDPNADPSLGIYPYIKEGRDISDDFLTRAAKIFDRYSKETDSPIGKIFKTYVPSSVKGINKELEQTANNQANEKIIKNIATLNNHLRDF